MRNETEKVQSTPDDRSFFRIVGNLGHLGMKVVKDGFDPTPRPVPPELLGKLPSGHIAFMGDFESKSTDK